MADVRLSVFQGMLEKQIWPKTGFRPYSKNAGQPNAATIYIPQEQSAEAPVLGGVNSGYFTTANNNAAATALTGVIRVNDQISYSNTIMRIPHPIILETLQESELTYDKASAIAEQQSQNLQKHLDDYILTRWAPTSADFMLPTTGKDSAGSVAMRTSNVVSGYGSSVAKIGFEDIMALENMIAKHSLPGTWYALPTVEQWEDMRRIKEMIDFEKTGNVGMLEKGIVGKWGMVNYLMPRHNETWGSNLLLDLTAPSAPVAIAYGGTVNANCVSTMLVWNDSAVERNEGSVAFFSRKADPFYMGDIYNWGVRVGASPRRLDGKGVIALYEAPIS